MKSDEFAFPELLDKRRDRRNYKIPNPKSTPKEIVGHHGHHPHGTSILWPALYEHLRKTKGMSKEKAARISNAAWNKKHAGLKTNTPTSVRGVVKAQPGPSDVHAPGGSKRRRKKKRGKKVYDQPVVKVRRVRTAAGVKRYKLPIGTPLTGQGKLDRLQDIKDRLLPSHRRDRQSVIERANRPKKGSGKSKVARTGSDVVAGLRNMDLERQRSDEKALRRAQIVERQAQNRKASSAAREGASTFGGYDDPDMAKIARAYHGAARNKNAWVAVADVRVGVKGMDKTRFDAAMRKFFRDSGSMLVPESNQKTLTEADKAASVRIGGEDKHLIRIQHLGGQMAKSQEVSTDVEFAKVDEENRNVFGWAYVTHDAEGNVNEDVSGDFVDDHTEIEKAAYTFVLESREGDADHDNIVKSTLVESFMATPEKLEKMGIPEGTVPTGWWVGFHVEDDDVWDGVKKGRYSSFSIYGKGRSTPVPDDDEERVSKGMLSDEFVLAKALMGGGAGTYGTPTPKGRTSGRWKRRTRRPGRRRQPRPVAKRQFSTSERKALTDKGQAMRGGSYPVPNLRSLNDAIQAYGRSKPEDRARLKRHLLKQARRLNAPDATVTRIKGLGKGGVRKARVKKECTNTHMDVSMGTIDWGDNKGKFSVRRSQSETHVFDTEEEAAEFMVGGKKVRSSKKEVVY